MVIRKFHLLTANISSGFIFEQTQNSPLRLFKRMEREPQAGGWCERILTKKGLRSRLWSVPYGNRTRVTAVKGRCPRPLDERDTTTPKAIAKLCIARRACKTTAPLLLCQLSLGEDDKDETTASQARG